MKLYDTARAPNPRRVRMYLAEKGISVPLVPVDLGRMEHRAPAFAAINPLQHTPALELDDGTVLTESIAICRYFEELRPEPPRSASARSTAPRSRCGSAVSNSGFSGRRPLSSATSIRRWPRWRRRCRNGARATSRA